MGKPKRRFLIRGLRADDLSELIRREKAFGKSAWKDPESFLGPNRFVSIATEDGKIVGYQVTYCLPSGEHRAKVLLEKEFDKKDYFESLMYPAFIRYGAGMKIDHIKVKDK